MITPEMRLAGWRECPTDAVRKDWEAKGGRWQVVYEYETESPRTIVVAEKWGIDSDAPHRPVHPSTWDYAAEGWPDNFPKEPGLWWRKEIPRFPVLVRLLDDYGLDPVLVWSALNSDAFGEVVDDGQWIAPCVKPGWYDSSNR